MNILREHSLAWRRRSIISFLHVYMEERKSAEGGGAQRLANKTTECHWQLTGQSGCDLLRAVPFLDGIHTMEKVDHDRARQRAT